MRKEIIKARKKLERDEKKRLKEIELEEKEKKEEKSKRGRKRKHPKRKIGQNQQKKPDSKKMKKETQFNAEELVADIKTEIERQEEDSDSDDDKPLALMAPPKSKGRKRPIKKVRDIFSQIWYFRKVADFWVIVNFRRITYYSR